MVTAEFLWLAESLTLRRRFRLQCLVESAALIVDSWNALQGLRSTKIVRL
jgi:hypothetical protein